MIIFKQYRCNGSGDGDGTDNGNGDDGGDDGGDDWPADDSTTYDD